MEFFSFGQEARGFIAVGQFATGVIAIGQVATGVIAVGQMARGVIAIGQLAIGGFTVGMGAFGAVRTWGMIGVGGISRGLLVLSLLPRRKAEVELPATVSARTLLDGGTNAGWIQVRVLPRGRSGVRVVSGSQELPVQFEGPLETRARMAAQLGASEMLLYVTREQDADDGAEGYRAQPSTHAVLRCTDVREIPRASDDVSVGGWIARGIAMTVLTVGVALGGTYGVFWTTP